MAGKKTPTPAAIDPRPVGSYVVSEEYPPDSGNLLYHIQHVGADGEMGEIIVTEKELFSIAIQAVEVINVAAAKRSSG